MRRLAMLLCLLPTPAFAQQKKDAKATPRILVSVPLGVKAGSTSKITLRGFNLDKATEAFANEPAVNIKLLDKSKSPPSDAKYLERLGDTQATLEITPTVQDKHSIGIVIKTAEEVSAPYSVYVDATSPVAEKEANDGFRQAQMVTLPLLLDGSVRQNQDVDVFGFDASTGQKVAFEAFAARHGSPVNPLLTLYDANGNQVAAGTKHKDSADCVLSTTLPAAGTYYLVLMDAHDLGGATHVYRLAGRIVKD